MSYLHKHPGKRDYTGTWIQEIWNTDYIIFCALKYTQVVDRKREVGLLSCPETKRACWRKSGCDANPQDGSFWYQKQHQ